MFLGTTNKLYFVDKTENNPTQVNGHPAWASEVDINTWDMRPMDVVSNAFCAGGTVLADGRWLNVGGNQAVIAGGVAAGDPGSAAQSGQNVYGNADGRKAVRILTPCDDQNCNWIDNPANYMTSERWYPTLETLEDGSAIIFGGCQNGGYVNTPDQDNPTFEYWPAKGNGQLTTLNILKNTLPVNLFPLVWLLPSGMMLIQAERQAVIFDRYTNTEYPIDDIPDCVRVYPASAATTVFPMTPANNWTATIIFCGGSDIAKDQWTPATWTIVNYPAHQSCVTISPDVDLTWHQDDWLDAGRTMGQFINLPDGRLFFVNGAATGTAGYGNESWAIGQSYADNPSLQAYYYDPAAAKGSKWSKAASSTIPRMYHSSATLLPDGSVAISGSNPNADFVDSKQFPTTPNPTYKYGSELAIEVFYPSYYDKPRPKPTNLPTQIGYGGDYFNIELSHSDLGITRNINTTKAVLIRTGFSTHAMNMGQRHVELASAFTTHDDGSATLHVSPVPSPSILVPGPALLFIVVNGVPSVGQWVTIGSGNIETQPVAPPVQLPQSSWSAEQVQLGT